MQVTAYRRCHQVLVRGFGDGRNKYADSAKIVLAQSAESANVSSLPLSDPNHKPNTKMKITISHDQDSIDPSATYSDEQFVEVRKALEAEYEKAILAQYPEAEIDFGGTDTTYAIRVTETGMDDPSDIEDNVQSICEGVFETGNFWL
jgi:hypothetical protein